MEDNLKKLRKYLETHGITQEQIAKEFGVTKSAINQLLTGKRPFGKQSAKRWSERFGLSVAWLLTGEGDMLKTANIAIDHSVAGNNNNVAVQTPGLIGKALDEIAAQRKLVERLVTMLEKVVEQLTSRKE